MNLRCLYGLAQVPCDTTLRRRLDPISPVRYRRAFQQVLQRAQRGKVLQRMSAWRGHYLVAVDGTGTFSSQRIHGPCCLRARHRNGSDHVLPSAVVCGDGASGSAAGAADGDSSGSQRGWLDEERLRAGCLGPASSGPGFALSAHETDRDCRWAVLAGSRCCRVRSGVAPARMRGGRSPGSPICRSIRITPANWPARLAVAGRSRTRPLTR